jgi:hypothetical protein
VGQTIEYTVVQPLGPNEQCTDELGLGDGATITATIREFTGGNQNSCLVAAADMTTSTGAWTVTGPLEGSVGADLGANYSVTAASDCHYTGPIFISGRDAPLLAVQVDQTTDPNCPNTCHGEWYVSESKN